MRSAFFFVFLAIFGFSSTVFGSNPLPFVNQPLIPASTAPGGSAFTLTVTGSQFVSGATVLWNGSPRSTTFVDAAKVQAQVSAADIASLGTATITVVNPAPGGGASNVVYFPVSMPRTTLAFGAKDYSLPSGAGVQLPADVNGDGKPDIIGSDGVNNKATVAAFLGNGDGTFESPLTSPTACTSDSSIQVLNVGDFNNDGKLDVLLVDYPVEHVCVMLGNGDGTFQRGSSVVVSANEVPSAVVGDFNGDGKLDVAIATGTDDVDVLLGNGDGTLQSPIAYSSGFNYPETSYMGVGDFNGDGKLDLLVDGGGLVLLFGNGDGTFQTGVQIPASYELDQLLVADFNGDGYLDIASGDSETAYISVFFGKGDGTFQPEVESPSPFVETRCGSFGDFNNDGKLDIVCSGSPARSFINFGGSVFLGNGDGSFTPTQVFSDPSGAGLVTSTFADFNNDGQLDLLGLTGYNMPIYLQTTLDTQPQNLAFQSQPVGTKSKRQGSTVTNIGTFTINISSINLVGANAGDFIQTNDCGSALTPGASCSFTAQFAPSQSPPVLESAQIAITDNAVSSPQYIDLFGSNTGELLTPHVLKFGSVPVGQNKNATVTLTNNSGTGLPVGKQFNIYGSDPQDFSQTNNCPATLGAHKSCTIRVTFSPTTIGRRTGSLTAHDLPYKTYMIGTGE